jgi:hypothetical protein
MPCWPGTVAGAHFDRLFVTSVTIVITPSVTQVDSPHECHVVVGRHWMTHQHQLLMVRAAAPHAIVKKSFSPGCRNLVSESSVFLGAER